MSSLAAMSRSRSPGSWAMHSSTRAWLVRKLQVGILALYHYLKVISGKILLVSGCRRSFETRASRIRRCRPGRVGAPGQMPATKHQLAGAIGPLAVWPGLHRGPAWRAGGAPPVREEAVMESERQHPMTGGEAALAVTAARTMRAIVQDGYGPTDVLRLARIAPPQIADREVLVRVHAAGLDRGTWHLMTGRPYLLRLMAG